ncbi:MAG: DNA polymerase III subunit delta' [Desulfovibrionales bacterium]
MTENSGFKSAPAEQPKVVGMLKTLSATPPQVLLLEGGNAELREELSLTWAAILNCPAPDGPCFTCPTCLQISEKVNQDLFFLDGGKERIKIDSVREIRSLLGQPPKGRGRRVVILAEAQSLTIEAANALLKSMEEPAPGNAFVLLAPQRERLLPTLVSRSWVLTLGWRRQPPDEEAVAWVGQLLRFTQTGRNWFSKTGVKNAVDPDLVKKILHALQGWVLSVQSGKPLEEPFASWGKGQDRKEMLRIGHLIDLAHEHLDHQVNPALVLEWLSIQLWEQKNR